MCSILPVFAVHGIPGSDVLCLSWPDDENFHTISMPSAVSDEPGTYAVTGLDPDATYEFKLRADLNGKVVYGTTVEETTDAAGDGGGLNATFTPVTDGPVNVEVDWSGASAEDVSVEARFDIGGGLMAEWPENPAINYVSSGGSGDYTGYISISPGVQYQLRLTDDNGDKSGWTTVDTASSDRPAPTGLTATDIGDNQLQLTWGYSGDTADTLFSVVQFQYYSGNNTLETMANGDPVDSLAGVTSATVTASANAVYFVVACATIGTPFYYDASAPSNAVMGSGAQVGAIPATPQDLKAYVTGQNNITLIWDNTSNNEDGFQVERKLDVDPDSAWQVVKTAGTDGVTVVDTLPGQAADWVKKYDYRVEAFNGFGTSQPSNVAVQSGVALEAVGFANDITILKDKGQQSPYSGAQWKDASLGDGGVPGPESTFLDGTVDDGPDEHEYPIAVNRSTPGNPNYLVSNIHLAFNGSVNGGNFEVKGTGFDTRSLSQAGNGGLNSASIQATSPISSSIDFEELTIVWSMSTDGGHTWFTVGTSANPYFVAGASVPNPNSEQTALETVLYTACHAAKGDTPHNGDPMHNAGEAAADNQVANDIFSAFQGLHMEDVEFDPLSYYGTGYITPTGSLDSLLKTGSSDCIGWAEFLQKAMILSGISGVSDPTIDQPYFPNNTTGMLIANWNFHGPGDPTLSPGNLGYNWYNYYISGQHLITNTGYAWAGTPQVTQGVGIPGQSNSTPPSLFEDHKIVELTNFAGTLAFDPSYGKGSYTSIQILVNHEVQGFYATPPHMNLPIPANAIVYLFRKNPNYVG